MSEPRTLYSISLKPRFRLYALEKTVSEYCLLNQPDPLQPPNSGDTLALRLDTETVFRDAILLFFDHSIRFNSDSGPKKQGQA